MPRSRARYHQPPTQQPTPTPTPRNPRLNQKLLLGAFLLLLSLLLLLILIKSLPSLTLWPTYQPLPSAAWFERSAPCSTPRAPHKAIRTTLKTISALVTELNRTITTTCPGCVWRTAGGEVCVRTFYDDGDVALLTFATLLIVTFWILGMLNFLEGVADIAPPFDMRVRIWGVGGAVVVVAGLAMGVVRALWYWCVLFVLGAAFGGMVIGVFATREEQVVEWEEEVKAEADKSAYAERGEI